MNQALSPSEITRYNDYWMTSVGEYNVMNNFEKFVKTDDDNYKQQVVQNLNYLKLKHIEILMNENQGKLKNSETEEDIFLYQNIHTNLQALRRSITEILGTVILG